MQNAERTGAQSVPVAMSVCFKHEKASAIFNLGKKIGNV